eukprot:7291927-Alexandrium_andersonii.AAC.1
MAASKHRSRTLGNERNPQRHTPCTRPSLGKAAPSAGALSRRGRQADARGRRGRSAPRGGSVGHSGHAACFAADTERGRGLRP